MTTLKYSRQREAIKEYLRNTYDHPTADMVYIQIKQEFPNISLGTVYRNLNLLADIGEAIRIVTPEGGDRYDGHVDPHYHFVCEKCSNVYDLKMDVSFMNEVNKMANEQFDQGEIRTHSTIFHGTCSKCLDLKK